MNKLEETIIDGLAVMSSHPTISNPVNLEPDELLLCENFTHSNNTNYSYLKDKIDKGDYTFVIYERLVEEPIVNWFDKVYLKHRAFTLPSSEERNIIGLLIDGKVFAVVILNKVISENGTFYCPVNGTVYVKALPELEAHVIDNFNVHLKATMKFFTAATDTKLGCGSCVHTCIDLVDDGLS